MKAATKVFGHKPARQVEPGGVFSVLADRTPSYAQPVQTAAAPSAASSGDKGKGKAKGTGGAASTFAFSFFSAQQEDEEEEEAQGGDEVSQQEPEAATMDHATPGDAQTGRTLRHGSHFGRGTALLPKAKARQAQQGRKNKRGRSESTDSSKARTKAKAKAKAHAYQAVAKSAAANFFGAAPEVNARTVRAGSAAVRTRPGAGGGAGGRRRHTPHQERYKPWQVKFGGRAGAPQEGASGEGEQEGDGEDGGDGEEGDGSTFHKAVSSAEVWAEARQRLGKSFKRRRRDAKRQRRRR